MSVVRRSGSPAPSRATRHSSIEPSTGAVNRTDRPSAEGTSRGPSPSVTSLFIAGVGLELAASRGGPCPGPGRSRTRPRRSARSRSDSPTRGQRSPSARIALPSRVHVGSTKIESAAVRDEADVPGRHVHRVDPEPGREVRVPAAVRRERDARPVRRPGGVRLGRRPDHQRPRRARLDVHQPEVLVLVVDEPGAVVLVAEAVDEPVVGQRRLAGLRLRGAAAAAAVLLGGRAERRRQHRERASVRRPRELGHALGQVGRAGGPRRRRAAAGRPGSSRRGPSRPSAGPAPPPRTGGGR